MSVEMQSKNDEELDIRFENRNGYLYVFFTGRRDNLKEAERFWQHAIDECHKREFKRLLVEQDFPKALSTIDAYQLAVAISEMNIGDLKIVFVDRDIEQNNINMFAETVAVNRGGFGRVFVNFHDAETWLLS